MKKLIKGIVEYRKNHRPQMLDTFAKLAHGQSPDTLFISCSDSRVAPNWFASTDPGDLFVIRNVGNIVPPCGPDGLSLSDEAEAAAIEFAVRKLNITDIIVCGHSNCGAMGALYAGRKKLDAPNLKAWLRHSDSLLSQSVADPNELSQRNVLLQLEHLKTYPPIAEGLKNKTLHLHGWWFDIAKADVYAYESSQKRFALIDAKEAERLLDRLDE